MEKQVEYGIKYRVTAIGKDRYLLFPTRVVEGYTVDNVFISDEPLKVLHKKEDVDKCFFVVDDVLTEEQVKEKYNFSEENKDFANEYYKTIKDNLLIVETMDEGLEKLSFNIQSMDLEAFKIVFQLISREPVTEDVITRLTDREKEYLLEELRQYSEQFQQEEQLRNSSPDEIVQEKMKSIEEEVAKENKKFAKRLRDISYSGLKEYISERVVGHDEEISKIAKILYYNMTAKKNERIKSLLLVGPTGLGKSEIFRAAGNYLDVPMVEYNLTDIDIDKQGLLVVPMEEIVQELLDESKGSLKRAERGIIYLEDLDKITEVGLGLVNPLKNILSSFDAWDIDVDGMPPGTNFSTDKLNKVFAGEFEEVLGPERKMGYISNDKVDLTLREKLIDKKYFTPEELSRIDEVIEYKFKDLDFETKKRILLESKQSLLFENKKRYKRQFKVDLDVKDDYVDAIFDNIGASSYGMIRTINNKVNETLDKAEIALAENKDKKYKRLVLTKDTVENPNKFDLS